MIRGSEKGSPGFPDRTAGISLGWALPPSSGIRVSLLPRVDGYCNEDNFRRNSRRQTFTEIDVCRAYQNIRILIICRIIPMANKPTPMAAKRDCRISFWTCGSRSFIASLSSASRDTPIRRAFRFVIIRPSASITPPDSVIRSPNIFSHLYIIKQPPWQKFHSRPS